MMLQEIKSSCIITKLLC